jgi:hypothetical protein
MTLLRSTFGFCAPDFDSFHRFLRILPLLAVLAGASFCPAQSKPAEPAAPDVLVLSNGDTLHGKFVSAIQGKVTFHTDATGDITLDWDKIKELHTSQPFAVINKNLKLHGRKNAGEIPHGAVAMENQQVELAGTANVPPPPPIPVKDAAYVLDLATLDKEVHHQPGILGGWNGAATAGATVVAATQNQYTVSGGIGLVRSIPTVAWLNPRNRTSLDFTGSFGKITQPAYTVPATPTTPATTVAAVTTKSAIYHADAERDEYLTTKIFALAQTAFDHNYSQDLDLQQIYGGGLGWTLIKTPKQQADLKATVQYEKQEFITGSSGSNQNLIGSTFGADYLLHLKLVTYTQTLAYIPAYNNERAYSASETDTLAFPTYKNLSFSVGTIDTYLNDPPVSLPPTKRNSFQFTLGATYAIKSKY